MLDKNTENLFYNYEPRRVFMAVNPELGGDTDVAGMRGLRYGGPRKKVEAQMAVEEDAERGQEGTKKAAEARDQKTEEARQTALREEKELKSDVEKQRALIERIKGEIDSVLQVEFLRQNPDRLRVLMDFVKSCSPYVGGKKQLDEWGNGFQKAMFPQGIPGVSWYTPYVRALQEYLNGAIPGSFSGTNNPFRKIDGYMGGFTVSALAKRLNDIRKDIDYEDDAMDRTLSYSMNGLPEGARKMKYDEAIGFLSGSVVDEPALEPIPTHEATAEESASNESPEALSGDPNSRASKLAEKFIRPKIGKSQKSAEELYEEQTKDLRELSKMAQDPTSFMFSIRQDFAPNASRAGSKPQLAFGKVKEAYKVYQEAMEKHDKLVDSGASREEIAVAKAEFDAANAQYTARLLQLETAVESLKTDEKSIMEIARGKYVKRVSDLIEKYRIPSDIDLTSDRYNVRGASKIPYVEGAGYLDATFVRKFLSEDQVAPFETMEEVRAAVKKQGKGRLETERSFEERTGGAINEAALLKGINDAIRMRNLNRFVAERVQAERLFDEDVEALRKKVDAQAKGGGYEPFEFGRASL
jgi:hypothetical protein